MIEFTTHDIIRKTISRHGFATTLLLNKMKQEIFSDLQLELVMVELSRDSINMAVSCNPRWEWDENHERIILIDYDNKFKEEYLNLCKKYSRKVVKHDLIGDKLIIDKMEDDDFENKEIDIIMNKLKEL